MSNRVLRLRAALLTAQRAGPIRVTRRVFRRVRLRTVNPRFAPQLYPPVTHRAAPNVALDRAFAAILSARSAGHQEYDAAHSTVTLLSQAPVRLPPASWASSPIRDPLWQFQLHGWEWAYGALWGGGLEHEHPLERAVGEPAPPPQPRHHPAVDLRALLEDWRRRVPFGRGPAWEPYPTSRRLALLCALWQTLPDDDLLSAIGQTAAYLADNLERDLDNNHLIANLKALAWVQLVAPRVAPRGDWTRRFWRALVRQVLPDGGHDERSTGYHTAVLLDALETAALCNALERALPPVAASAIRAMAHFARCLTRPDGRLPLLNDSQRDEPLPLAAVLALTGPLDGRTPTDATRLQLRPDAQHSACFPQTGYAVLRRDDLYLLFDAGPLGPDHCPGHGHADALSVELWAAGRPLLLDPGTYSYAATSWRDTFRGTAAHSTAQVDGQEQAEFAGPFRIGALPTARIVSFTPDPQPAVAGEHDGYARLRQPVCHRRYVELTGPRHVTLTDSFTGFGKHEIVLRLHLAPGAEIALRPHGALVHWPDETCMELVFDHPEAAVRAEPGWVSERWYQKTATTVVTCTLQSFVPCSVTTTLLISR